MRVQSLPLRCAKCEHQWEDDIVSDCSFDLAIASIQDVARRGCPECGAKGEKVVMIRLLKEPSRAHPG